MRYAVIVMLDTERTPDNIIGEIVSNLEFDPTPATTVDAVVVLTDDGTEIGTYNRKEKK